MVEIHNYQNASSRAQKLTNWTTLNRKVLTKFGFAIPKEIIDDIIQSKNDAVVLFLFGLRRVIEDKLQNNAKNEVPQYYEVAPIAVYQPEESVPTRRKAGPSNPKSKPSHVGLNRVSPGGKKAQKADSVQSLSDQLSLTV